MDNGYTRFFGDQELAAETACRECALKNGHSIEEADSCDDGDVGCLCCPWGGAQVPNEE